VSLKTKAKKSVTITVTIALILFSYNTWEDYKIRYKDSLRQVVVENVERLRNCRKPQNGYKVYQCPECGTKKYVPFTCKSRLCTSCGTKAANEWADKIHHRLLKVPHRHVVFTIPDTLWELFMNPKFQKILFEASKMTMEKMIRLSNKRSKKKELPKCRETNIFIHNHFKNYPEGFVVYGKTRFEKRDGWNMARYIGRYVKHPPIAESRITAYDGKQVTFWYKDTRTKQKITVTMDKFEFVHRLLSHIPEKNFKIVRYVGLYSRRGYKHRQTEFSDGEAILIKRSWRDEIKRTFHNDPLKCPNCGTEMELVEICFEGSESYPDEEPPPSKPPPPQNRTLSQQERLQLIIALIIENQDNGGGASIEKVVSEAAVRGIEREQVLNDIQHLMFEGYVYEPKRGEIRYAL
jgi:uncharacterized Zn finger protein (UPF0148 family)